MLLFLLHLNDVRVNNNASLEIQLFVRKINPLIDISFINSRCLNSTPCRADYRKYQRSLPILCFCFTWDDDYTRIPRVGAGRGIRSAFTR